MFHITLILADTLIIASGNEMGWEELAKIYIVASLKNLYEAVNN